MPGISRVGATCCYVLSGAIRRRQFYGSFHLRGTVLLLNLVNVGLLKEHQSRFRIASLCPSLRVYGHLKPCSLLLEYSLVVQLNLSIVRLYCDS